MAKKACWIIGLLATAALVFWIWWALWGNHPPSGHVPSDTWLNVVLGVAAFLTGAAVLVGGGFAFLYGRRASVGIAANVYPTDSGFVVSTKPRVRAVGIFRVSFGEDSDKAVEVRLREVFVDSQGDLDEGSYWEKKGFFNQQYVDPGEELTTSVTFAPVQPADTVIGWQVYLRVTAPTRFGRFRTNWWADQEFVARPREPVS